MNTFTYNGDCNPRQCPFYSACTYDEDERCFYEEFVELSPRQVALIKEMFDVKFEREVTNYNGTINKSTVRRQIPEHD